MTNLPASKVLQKYDTLYQTLFEEWILTVEKENRSFVSFWTHCKKATKKSRSIVSYKAALQAFFSGMKHKTLDIIVEAMQSVEGEEEEEQEGQDVDLEDLFQVDMNTPLAEGGEAVIYNAVHYQQTLENRYVIRVARSPDAESSIKIEEEILK